MKSWMAQSLSLISEEEHTRRRAVFPEYPEVSLLRTYLHFIARSNFHSLDNCGFLKSGEMLDTTRRRANAFQTGYLVEQNRLDNALY